MMGRKMEEEDWRQAYCGAKGIPATGWSNLSIDVMHNNLGVEHKMLCVKSSGSILAACGTSHMHPAGTRSIRIPAEDDATKAAQDVLGQYAALIRYRTVLVDLRHRVAVGAISKGEAIAVLTRDFPAITAAVAMRQIPDKAPGTPTDPAPAAPDMRVGWLLWQDSLREFLYFEEPMVPPDPTRFRAVWKASGGGSRKPSRNLWVFDNDTGRKAYSITTEAGAKIQPYFDVPPPTDPNLYHFVVQGEQVGNLIRLWITRQTAEYLRFKLGSLESDDLSRAVLAVAQQRGTAAPQPVAVDSAVDIYLTIEAYQSLITAFEGVSDEHLMQLCAQAFESSG